MGLTSFSSDESDRRHVRAGFRAFGAGLRGELHPPPSAFAVQTPARFHSQHASVLHALCALGIELTDAEPLVALTRAAGGTEFCVLRAGVLYLVRQLSGHLADVYRVSP